MKYDSKQTPPLMIGINLIIIFLMLLSAFFALILTEKQMTIIMSALLSLWALSFVGVIIEWIYWKVKEGKEDGQ